MDPKTKIPASRSHFRRFCHVSPRRHLTFDTPSLRLHCIYPTSPDITVRPKIPSRRTLNPSQTGFCFRHRPCRTRRRTAKVFSPRDAIREFLSPRRREFNPFMGLCPAPFFPELRASTEKQVHFTTNDSRQPHVLCRIRRTISTECIHRSGKETQRIDCRLQKAKRAERNKIAVYYYRSEAYSFRYCTNQICHLLKSCFVQYPAIDSFFIILYFR